MHTPIAIRIVRWSVCGVIIAAIIAGLYVSGSPANRRRATLDERRVSNLTQLSGALDTHMQTRRELPPTLDALAQAQPYLLTELRDPTTGAFYEYRTLSTSTYELCATFDLPTQDEQLVPPAPAKDFAGNPTFTSHAAGRTCYELRVRIYPTDPLYPKPLPSL
jgi:hypothetical protein